MIETQQPSPLGSEVTAVNRGLWVGKQVPRIEAVVFVSRELSAVKVSQQYLSA